MPVTTTSLLYGDSEELSKGTRGVSWPAPDSGRNLLNSRLPGTRAFTERVNAWQPPNPLTTKASDNPMLLGALGMTNPIRVRGIVQRVEERGVSSATFDKPHGIYTTPSEYVSPHKGLGGEVSYWKVNPGAKVLKFVDDGTDRGVVMRKGAVSAGSGVWAARELLGEVEFKRISSMSKIDLISEFKVKYPDVKWGSYYDKQEAIEAIGGILAKKGGYDAISLTDKVAPEFSEYVGLTSKSMTPIK